MGHSAKLEASIAISTNGSRGGSQFLSDSFHGELAAERKLNLADAYGREP